MVDEDYLWTIHICALSRADCIVRNGFSFGQAFSGTVFILSLVHPPRGGSRGGPGLSCRMNSQVLGRFRTAAITHVSL